MVFGGKEKVSGQTFQEQHYLDLDRGMGFCKEDCKGGTMSRVEEAGS